MKEKETKMSIYNGLLKFLSSFATIFDDNDGGFHKLDSQYRFTRKRNFAPDGTFSMSDIEKAYYFAEQMASNDFHRPIRSGGNLSRNEFDIFKNTFQGKLSEYAIYHLFDGIADINEPDLAIYKRGKWDNGDFVVNGKRLAIKSAKYFSQLLLLEKEDWNENGIYIPDINTGGLFDYFILVRIKPNIDDYHTKEDIKNVTWLYQVVGYITREDLILIIKNKHIIPKRALLNGKTPMDADNYYVQSGDLKDIEKLIEEIINGSNI